MSSYTFKAVRFNKEREVRKRALVFELSCIFANRANLFVVSNPHEPRLVFTECGPLGEPSVFLLCQSVDGPQVMPAFA